MMQKSINILGVTGSIGSSARDVILAQPDCFDVRVITAHSRVKELAQMAVQLNASVAVITDESLLPQLREMLDGSAITAMGGEAALFEALSFDVDVTLAAIVGIAGLKPIMHAIKHSKAVAIANKEPLVAAGAQVIAAARKHKTTLLPVDSEHNAIFQVFDFDNKEQIERIILTASGGPFRDWSYSQMEQATREQALKHPNWSMGAKITIDSATMMNKALEIIEAAVLFDMDADQIDVVIHPQSIIHSMVEYCDGSILSQMGASDMRTPIANVLAYPDRLKTPGGKLDFHQLTHGLSFEKPDTHRFPSLRLAYDCLRNGQAACVAFNAANEEAVATFLSSSMRFTAIVDIVEETLQRAHTQNLSSIEEISEYDKTIRELTRDIIAVRQNLKTA